MPFAIDLHNLLVLDRVEPDGSRRQVLGRELDRPGILVPEEGAKAPDLKLLHRVRCGHPRANQRASLLLEGHHRRGVLAIEAHRVHDDIHLTVEIMEPRRGVDGKALHSPLPEEPVVRSVGGDVNIRPFQ